MSYIELSKKEILWQTAITIGVMWFSYELMPSTDLSRVDEADVFAALHSWVIGCNLFGFVLVALVMKFVQLARGIHVSVEDRILGLAWFFVPPFLAGYLVEPFSLIAMQVSFWLFQPYGWHQWAGVALPANRISSVEHEWALSQRVVQYDPLDYFDFSRGIFVGLDEQDSPIYLTRQQARMHLAATGMSRVGKNVGVGLVVSQLAALGENLVCFLPKDDAHMPGVLQAIAERYRKRFVFIDLNASVPQLNPFRGCSPRDIETMMTQTFSLYETPDNSAVYKIEERAQCRLVSQLTFRSLPHLFALASQIDSVVKARRYFEALKELCELPPVQTADGIDLNTVIAEPNVIVCIIGSLEHEPTMRLQRLLLQLTTIIVAQKARRESQTHTTIFIDEFKYCLCRAALAALSTLADKHATVCLAHQSLGDFEDTNDLPSAAVRGAVLDNTGLKFLFRSNDQRTAQWIEDLCGSIPMHTESVSGVAFGQGQADSWRETSGPLFHANRIKALPPLKAILYGVGVPKLVTFGYLPRGPRPNPVPAPPDEVGESEVI